ncbi:MAG: TrkA-N domain protein, partial [Thermoleophilia bacterium]|nr:TrkA-N domain protein [Thermoleophilia bacterium]
MSQRTTNAARAQVRAASKSREARGASGGADGGEDDRRPDRTSGPVGVPAGPGMPARPGLRARLRYRFDLTLSRGSGALIGWLGLVTLGFVAITGLLLMAAVATSGGKINDNPDNSFIENSWRALMRTLDAGTVTGDQGWWIRAASLFITIAGIFIFSTLIGLIASVIDRAIESLRKGRGVVPEVGHTLVLGWSEKLHTIISELRIANENQHRS